MCRKRSNSDFAKKLWFLFVSQKGSHVKLRKIFSGKITTVIVPNHKELAQGTLRNILRQAQIEIKEFLNLTA
ncbi:MAG: addiction module toxin, HicA family [Candidatus Doudnabacteria bacterium CG10_big_fil_rev_8_21_14_0_10_42_18]|uniref:Addiction module toxin, HicA family n=1 Tax=Candidatus Doudnabacteria bacterium CG10_big_fil_rev_8_21_14_0_10_42_18 TaxID=1974552 RepID=A0A2H0VBS2_9BACT|nr:MAG: addiction module toxin, HicA family [Candidatus Doudnabacteria bacterium CG10_big_fil_rev_8_21_14_0_10_42_18]